MNSQLGPTHWDSWQINAVPWGSEWQFTFDKMAHVTAKEICLSHFMCVQFQATMAWETVMMQKDA